MTDRPLVMVGIVVALVVFGVMAAVFLSAQMGRSQRFDDAPRQAIPQERIVQKAKKKFFDVNILPAFAADGGWELYIRYDYDDEDTGILIANKDSIKADSPLGAKGSRIFWIGVDGYVHSYDVVTHTYDAAALAPNGYGGESAIFESFGWEVSVEDGAFVFVSVLSGVEEEDEATSEVAPTGQGVGDAGQTTTVEPAQPVIPITTPDENLITAPSENTSGETPSYTYAQSGYEPAPSLFGGTFSASLLSSETCPALGLPVKVQDDPVVGILVSPTGELPTGAQLKIGTRPGNIDIQFENGGHTALYQGGTFSIQATRHAGAMIGTFSVPLTVYSAEGALLWDCTLAIVNE